MTDKELRNMGLHRIENPSHDNPMMPFTPWPDFPLRFTAEYPVMDFPLEVGFWAEKMGLQFLVLDAVYAVCTDKQNSFTFSFQASREACDLSGIKIQWFTDKLDEAIAHLNAKQIRFEIHQHSPIQRFARLRSPAGVTVEIWSGDEGNKGE